MRRPGKLKSYLVGGGERNVAVPPEDLAAAIDRRPFVPFRLHLSDGTAYEVRHPEMIMLGRRSAVIGISEEINGRPMYDRHVTVALLHIVRLEPLVQQQS
jgi:hypothetical protein